MCAVSQGTLLGEFVRVLAAGFQKDQRIRAGLGATRILRTRGGRNPFQNTAEAGSAGQKKDSATRAMQRAAREDDFMLQAAAMIQIKSFAPFPLPLTPRGQLFGCSVQMHVRNTVGSAGTHVLGIDPSRASRALLQPEARPRRPITRRPLSHINTVRTGSENEGRTLLEQAAGPVDVDAIVRG